MSKSVDVYETADAVGGHDTRSNVVHTTIHTGQSPKSTAYIPEAVPSGSGTDTLAPMGISGKAARWTVASKGACAPEPRGVHYQGLVDLLETGVAGLPDVNH